MSRILVRTHAFTPRTEAFVDRLSLESGRPVTLAVDETRGPVDCGGRSKLGLDPERLSALGLYAPPDAGWRCGDYALIAAREAFPDEDAFWLIEPDVRLRFPKASDFFAPCEDAARDLDFVAPHFAPSNPGWYWRTFMSDMHEQVYRCLFSLLFMRAGAVDAVARARRAASRETDAGPESARRWPNDEVLCATTLMAEGFRCADFNDLGLGVLHTRASLSFDTPIPGRWLERRPLDRLVHHPVLYGEEFRNKVRKLKEPMGFKSRMKLRGRMWRLRWLGR